MPNEEFSNLLADLYDVVTDSNKWGNFLASLCRMTGSDGAHLMCMDFENAEVSFSVHFGGENHWLKEYEKYAAKADTDLRSKFALENPCLPFHCGMLPSQKDFRRSEIFTEFFEPRDIYFHLGISIPESEVVQLGLILWRGKSKDPYEATDCDLISTVSPHLRRVSELQRLFHKSQFDSNPAIEVLQSLPIGIVLCDVDARIIFSNAMVQSLLEQGDGLSGRLGVLLGETSDATQEIHRHIRHAVEAYGSGNIPPATINIRRKRAESDLCLMISAVSGSSPAINVDLFQQSVAVVYVSDPEIRHETSASVLQRLFALTLSEARMLKSLIVHGSLKRAAEVNGITEGTARGYLKQIFSKTQTKSQVELIRLVSQSPAWLRHQSAKPFTAHAAE